jgi:uncharacterized protein YjiS (DUF1127 family)
VRDDPASLARLVDIVVLPAIPAWPPAPGWWVVIAVIVAASIAWSIRVRARYRANAYRRAALAELNDVALDDAAPMHVATVLKRTAIAGTGRAAVASLSGDEWVAWLNGRMRRPVFSDQPAELLAERIYRPGDAADRVVSAELIEAARVWIRRHRGAD